MVATVAMVAIVALAVLVALALVLCAPKVLRGTRSEAREIGTRAGLIQAWIEYGSGIRTGEGQENPSHHRYDDRSDFHGDLPTRKGFPDVRADYAHDARFCQRAAHTAIPGH
jgi:hypothetical protein